MKRLMLICTGMLLVLPDLAAAQTGQPQTRPAPGKPGKPGNPGRPGGPQIQPPRPGPGTRPPVRPAPVRPQPQPVRPQPKPPRPRPPQARPPHRPGAGRPPNFRPIHRPGFHYPRGYHYRRWSIGLLLPRLFLSTTYYFNDWSMLGVGAPPPGYRWVRYGPDLLLVQTRTGRIADVIYGAFY